MILYKVDSNWNFFLNFIAIKCFINMIFLEMDLRKCETNLTSRKEHFLCSETREVSRITTYAGVRRNRLGGNYSISVNSLMPANFWD
jgi:hypothetical protein